MWKATDGGILEAPADLVRRLLRHPDWWQLQGLVDARAPGAAPAAARAVADLVGRAEFVGFLRHRASGRLLKVYQSAIGERDYTLLTLTLPSGRQRLVAVRTTPVDDQPEFMVTHQGGNIALHLGEPVLLRDWDPSKHNYGGNYIIEEWDTKGKRWIPLDTGKTTAGHRTVGERVQEKVATFKKGKASADRTRIRPIPQADPVKRRTTEHLLVRTIKRDLGRAGTTPPENSRLGTVTPRAPFKTQSKLVVRLSGAVPSYLTKPFAGRQLASGLRQAKKGHVMTMPGRGIFEMHP
jgi:hypothetical protein